MMQLPVMNHLNLSFVLFILSFIVYFIQTFFRHPFFSSVIRLLFYSFLFILSFIFIIQYFFSSFINIFIYSFPGSDSPDNLRRVSCAVRVCIEDDGTRILHHVGERDVWCYIGDDYVLDGTEEFIDKQQMEKYKTRM